MAANLIYSETSLKSHVSRFHNSATYAEPSAVSSISRFEFYGWSKMKNLDKSGLLL